MNKQARLLQFSMAILFFFIGGARVWAGIQEGGGGEKKVISPSSESVSTFRMTFVGDLMCHESQFRHAKTGLNTYDFRGSYQEVLPLLKEPDFTYGNFESVCAGTSVAYMGYPGFNTPDAFITALDYAGFDLVSTANNHCMDQGEKGAQRTLKKLTESKIAYVGSYSSLADHDSTRIVDIKGTQVGFLSYTYGTNGRPVPNGKPWMVNLIDSSSFVTDIARARSQGAELVTVFLHFGKENEREPNAEQKRVVAKVIAAGADIIIGAHPHMIQPVEYFKASPKAKLDTGFVAWSMGNFISNQYWRYTDAGLILNLDIQRNIETDKIRIAEVSFVPTWVYRGRDPRKKMHVVFPAELPNTYHSTRYLPEEAIGRMKEAYADTREVVARNIPYIDLVRMRDWTYFERMRSIAVNMHPQLKSDVLGREYVRKGLDEAQLEGLGDLDEPKRRKGKGKRRR